MREIDTDALLGVADILGVGNPATATRQVTFDDENLQQVFDVTKAIRRQRAGLGTGIWQGALRNTHSGAGTLTEVIDPYQPLANGGDGALNGYPEIVPDDFDVWLLGLSVDADDPDDFDSCTVYIQADAKELGFVSEPGVAQQAWPLATFDSVIELGTFELATAGSSFDARVHSPRFVRRIRRGQDLGLQSTSGGVAGTIAVTAHFVIGLFPAPLGQDVGA